jgi:cytochrome o ubiquinol oxidase subunit 1
MFGRLSFESIVTDPIVWLAVGATTGVFALVVLWLVYRYGIRGFSKGLVGIWKNWLTSLDHKKIGIMYLILAAFMLFRGGVDAAMIRLQQIFAGSNGEFISSDQFQQVFSAHGTIMIFFVAMGFMFGIVNLILPLQIGKRDVAFPFLNSISFWLFAAGVVLVNVSLMIGEFSAAGWLAYPPLSGIEYSPGVGVDYWIWSLQIAGLGSLLSGINFMTTILKTRAEGMKFMKMPIFVHSVLYAMMLVAFAFPILTGTLLMLSLDRTIGTNFFSSDMGGNPMMYVNLIWAWGHPEVYILILPAFGIFSEIVATFSKKRLFGYTSMVVALVAITFLSFTVWLHHFFTMGAGANVNAFFGIMTAIIAIPTGVKIFNWLFTMYRGRVKFTTPMLWFMGFVLTFTIGGVAGVILSIPAINFQVHNTLFVVAHFHNMIIGGVLFGYFAGFTYWFPKIFGFKLNERLGRYAFWSWITGFLLAFMPLYILGLMGAARRVDTYDPSMGWQWLFIVAGIGIVFIGIGIALQVLQLIYSILKRKENRVGNDPWDGRTLEWATSSPAPAYNFAIEPIVQHRDDFWESKNRLSVGDIEERQYEDIVLPKNTSIGMFIAGCAFIFGFAIIWHIWWLAILMIPAIIVLFIIRANDEHTEIVIPANEVRRLELASQRREA